MLPQSVKAFYRDLIERAGSLPGVRSVGMARRIPLASSFGRWSIQSEGEVVETIMMGYAYGSDGLPLEEQEAGTNRVEILTDTETMGCSCSGRGGEQADRNFSE